MCTNCYRLEITNFIYSCTMQSSESYASSSQQQLTLIGFKIWNHLYQTRLERA